MRVLRIPREIHEKWSDTFVTKIACELNPWKDEIVKTRSYDDVIKENANTVIILAGINDIAQNTGPIQIKDIADNIFRMAEMAQKNNINVFICSVLPANRILWNKSIFKN